MLMNGCDRYINREIMMKRIFEFEVGLEGAERGGRRGRGRGHSRSHGQHREHHMHECHQRGDERFGMGGHGPRGRSRHGMGQGRGHGSGRHGQHRGARRISAEELQLLVLALLTEQSLHGYQIIKELDKRSHGFYKPSPGMIYPLLAFLEESDFAEVALEGSKKLFTLTATGQSFFKENAKEATDLLAWLEAQGQLIIAMENAYEVEQKTIHSPLRQKMRALRTLLQEVDHPEQEAALNTILDEAIAKIKAMQEA